VACEACLQSHTNVREPGESANRQIIEGTKEEGAHWALHGIIAGAALEEAGHALRAVGKGRTARSCLAGHHAAVGAVHWSHIAHPLLRKHV